MPQLPYRPHAQDHETDAVVWTTVAGRDVTRGELWNALYKVADASDWRLPIDKTLALTDAESAIVAEALVHLCGCRPTIRRLNATHVRVRAVGYYKAVGKS